MVEDATERRPRLRRLRIGAGVVMCVALLAGAVVGGLLYASSPSRGRRTQASDEMAVPRPTGLEAALDGMTVRLSWKAPEVGDDADMYFEITRNGSRQDLIRHTEWNDTWVGETPDPGRTYSYEVRTSFLENGQFRESIPSAPVEVTLPDWSVGNAALVGKFNMMRKTTESSDGWEDGATGDDDEWTWVFYPSCASGACDVHASMRMSPEWIHLRMHHSHWGQSWFGRAKNVSSWGCIPDDSGPNVFVSLRTIDPTWREERWLVGKVKGTVDIRFPRSSQCRYAYLTYSLEGRLLELVDAEPQRA